MGYMRHDAILVTSWKCAAIERAQQEALSIGLLIIGPSDEVINGYRTMLVIPDGSKEGWEESDEFNKKRELFIDFLKNQRDVDGGSSFEWVAVSYGRDDLQAAIVASEWAT